MITKRRYTKVQVKSKYSLYLILTEQLKELNLEIGDEVRTYVKEVEGKKIIIVDGLNE